MNEIETKFYDDLCNLINSDRRKTYTLNTNEEVDYRFYKSAGKLCFEVTRLQHPYSVGSYKIETHINIYSNNDKECNISGYIPDFLICIGDYNLGYAIEIDGFEWHEKTKEQAVNDRRKDRIYLQNGYIPIRFLGSEVFHESKRCVEEVISIIIENELSLFLRTNVEILETEVYWAKKRDAEFCKIIRNLASGFATVEAIKFTKNKIELSKNVI